MGTFCNVTTCFRTKNGMTNKQYRINGHTYNVDFTNI